MKLGTKIIGNYGAMIPLDFGEVVMIGNFSPEIKVKWEDGKKSSWLNVSEVCTLELLPERGLSPIGYYTEEAYYAA